MLCRSDEEICEAETEFRVYCITKIYLFDCFFFFLSFQWSWTPVCRAVTVMVTIWRAIQHELPPTFYLFLHIALNITPDFQLGRGKHCHVSARKAAIEHTTELIQTSVKANETRGTTYFQCSCESIFIWKLFTKFWKRFVVGQFN